jgi:hypothetical protein
MKGYFMRQRRQWSQVLRSMAPPLTAFLAGLGLLVACGGSSQLDDSTSAAGGASNLGGSDGVGLFHGGDGVGPIAGKGGFGNSGGGDGVGPIAGKGGFGNSGGGDGVGPIAGKRGKGGSGNNFGGGDGAGPIAGKGSGNTGGGDGVGPIAGKGGSGNTGGWDGVGPIAGNNGGDGTGIGGGDGVGPIAGNNGGDGTGIGGSDGSGIGGGDGVGPIAGSDGGDGSGIGGGDGSGIGGGDGSGIGGGDGSGIGGGDGSGIGGGDGTGIGGAGVGGDGGVAGAGCVPGPEACNGIDDNCDGQIDEPGAKGCESYFQDADGDGSGDPGSSLCLCAATASYPVKNGDDCNDHDAAIRPGAPEACNGRDDNCNALVDEGDGLCPCTVISSAGHAYQFCITPLPWVEAEAACQASGYHLTTIENASEQAFLSTGADLYSHAKFWIGINDRAVEGTFAWASGLPVTYTNWQPGEPNDAGGGEDCGQINRFYPASTWNDEPCDEALAYICRSN